MKYDQLIMLFCLLIFYYLFIIKYLQLNHGIV